MFFSKKVSKKANPRPSSVQKTTHIDIYIPSHYPAQKQSTINSLVHRAFTISVKEHLQTKLNHLKTALEKRTQQKKHNQNNQ